MAKRAVEFVYWDACVIQSYLEKIPGRWEILRDLLRASAEPGQPLQIVTSGWTIAEVAYFGSLELDYELPEAAEAINKFWESEVIKVVDISEAVGLKAKDIVRESHFGNYTIKPKDAVHAASALAQGVREFHTYDRKLAERLRAHYGLPAGEPTTFLIRAGALSPVPGAEQGVLDLSQAVSKLPQHGPLVGLTSEEILAALEPEAPQ